MAAESLENEESPLAKARLKYFIRFSEYYYSGQHGTHLVEIVFATIYWCGIPAERVADKLDELFESGDIEINLRNTFGVHCIAWGLFVPSNADARAIIASACIVLIKESLD